MWATFNLENREQDWRSLLLWTFYNLCTISEIMKCFCILTHLFYIPFQNEKVLNKDGFFWCLKAFHI